MDFRLLGPFEAVDAGRRLTVGRRQERVLLGLLLLEPGRAVPIDRLIDLLWEETAPPAARNSVYTYVARLRAGLAGYGTRIVTVTDGYRVDVDPATVDVHRFRTLLELAREMSSPDPRAAVLREALGLWRGPLLADVASDRLRERIGVDLREARLGAVELCAAAELAGGHAESAVRRLAGHIREHPTREDAVELLMTALYRCGRQAEALDAYRTARRLLVDELGVEPGPRLRRAHDRILRNEMETGPPDRVPAAPAGRAYLPRDATAFTGRAQLLRDLADLATPGPSVPPVVLLTGTAGVGKTAVAVHFGHRNADRFPDGQLYLDLRGYAPHRPLGDMEALTRILHALGVAPEAIPADLPSAAQHYRALLADRRYLIVLDNACSADQVRPLLPAAPGCFVVVTSRDRLSGLVARDGAHRLAVPPLTEVEAVTLLRQTIGADRVAAEPSAASALAAACGYLPLALRIAAATVADRPGGTLSERIAPLTGSHRLAHLEVDRDPRSSVRAAFDESYRALPAPARLLFRRLGLAPFPDYPVEVAAELAATGVEDAARLLERLAGAHLLTEHRPGRYAFHDLIRLYAGERAEAEDDPATRTAATERLYRWYLRCADEAANRAYPNFLRPPLPDAARTQPDGPGAPPVVFPTPGAAAAWFDVEGPNLSAAVEHSPPELAPHLAAAMRGYLCLRGNAHDWVTTAQHALAAAESTGDPAPLAATWLSVGHAHHALGQLEAATRGYTRAAAASRRAGWRECEATALHLRASAHLRRGRLAQVARGVSRALAINRAVGRELAQAVNLNLLGLLRSHRGELHAAAEQFTEAFTLHQRCRVPASQANALVLIATVEHELGRLREATAHFTEALALAEDCASTLATAAALRGLAAVRRDQGDHAEAERHARTALAMAERGGDQSEIAQVLTVLGSITSGLGRQASAIEHHERATALARAGTARYLTANALVGLGQAYHRSGRTEDGRRCTREAYALATRYGYQVVGGRALTVWAACELTAGAAEPAAELARRALVSHRHTGHRYGTAQALLVLSRTGRHRAACRTRALAIFNAIGTPETGP